MPRTARTASSQGIYHVMMRGVNRQQIFFDEQDNQYFLKVLARFRETCGYQLYAYCLMGNHVHLLIREGEKMGIGDVFRHINTSYVYWYNAKYERTGHLFQDRFRSEPVENQAYLMTVFRYILRNPVKAGQCERVEDYPWSSAREYLENRTYITDTLFMRKMMSVESMRVFLNLENEDQCMEMDENTPKKMTDERAMVLIRNKMGDGTPWIGRPEERDSLNNTLRSLVQAGISSRQLSRLTGISRKIVMKAIE